MQLRLEPWIPQGAEMVMNGKEGRGGDVNGMLMGVSLFTLGCEWRLEPGHV